MKLQDKVCVVTGAAGGIGGQLVSVLLSQGAKVAAVDLQSGPLQALQKAQHNSAKSLSIHELDITDRDAVRQLPGAVVQAHGCVDVLINCAGIVQPFLKVTDIPYDAVERVMNVNFYGTLYMTKAFLPYLLQRPEAYIANVSSMGGFLPVPGQALYGASKAAVKLMTEGLYAELLDTNVHVSIVFPGATATNITQNSGVAAPSVSKADMQSYAMLPPHAAAAQIVSGIQKNQFQIFTGRDSRTMNKLYRLNPQYATRLIAKKMKSLLN